MAKCKSCVVLPFLIGLVVSIVLGWWGFPKILYSQKRQPVRFDHVVHVDGLVMDCTDCHEFREDGSFAGLPSNRKCLGCHESIQGESEAEALYVAEYVQKDKEVDWLVYQAQPDNVYFSHIAHKDQDCKTCHLDLATTKGSLVYYENRLTGYSKDTMKMWQCEECHAKNGASNACFVCHK